MDLLHHLPDGCTESGMRVHLRSDRQGDGDGNHVEGTSMMPDRSRGGAAASKRNGDGVRSSCRSA
jgi:hypothetical protein